MYMASISCGWIGVLVSHGYEDVRVPLPASLMKATVIPSIVCCMVPLTDHLVVSGLVF